MLLEKQLITIRVKFAHKRWKNLRHYLLGHFMVKATLYPHKQNKINIVSNLPSIMSTIDQHIKKDKQVLDDPTISPQNRRHTSEELQALKSYKENHPEDSHDPTPLELYCDSHPDALECRMYDD